MYMTKAKNLKTPLETSQPTPADPIYTLPRAAAILDCNERILAEKFRKGAIPARKKLGKWYCTHSDLLAYIRS